MFADGIMEQTNTLGLDDYVLLGPVYNGLTVNQKFTNGQLFAGIAQTLKREKYEIFLGAYTDGPPRRIARTTILQSSAGGSKINWQADDVYYIASFASADALRGVCQGNLEVARPWWVQFGLWLRKNFPIAGIHSWNFWDAQEDIPFAKVDTAKHSITLDLRVFPAGMRFGWGGGPDTVPSGALFEDGRSLVCTEYPHLYDAIGTRWGSADSLHFNIPNSQGLVDVGYKAADTDFDTVAKLGGQKAISSGVDVSVAGHTVADTTEDNDDGAISAAATGQNVTRYPHKHDIPELDLDLTVGVTVNIPTMMPYIVGPKIITTNQ